MADWRTNLGIEIDDELLMFEEGNGESGKVEEGNDEEKR